MQTSGQFGVPPPEVPPQYNPVNNNMNTSSNSSNRATSTPGSNPSLGHMLFNLSNHDQQHGSLSPSSAFNTNPHSAHGQPANASPGLLGKATLISDNTDAKLLQEARTHPHHDFSHFLHAQAASSLEHFQQPGSASMEQNQRPNSMENVRALAAQQQQLLQPKQGNSASGMPPANTSMQAHAPVQPTMPTSNVQAFTPAATKHGHMAAPVLADPNSTQAPDQDDGEAQKQAQAMQLHHHHHRQLSLGLDEAAKFPASNILEHTERQVMNADPMSLGDIDQADEGEGAGAGNRWPRQETLALLKIRADMDAAFRDTSVKRPLWDEVSRKLGELGYERSAKKCKEKFENVNKYYKRTKGGKVGRQDGKNYRFFTQLEALSANTNTTTAAHTNSVTSSTPPSSIMLISNTTTNDHFHKLHAGAASAAEASFLQGSVLVGNPAQPPAETRTFVTSAVTQPPSQLYGTDSANRPPHLDGNVGAALHNSSQSSSADDDDDEDDDDDDDDVDDIIEEDDDGEYKNLKPHVPDVPHASSHGLPPTDESRKRKRKSSTTMMAFFEGLLNKVIQKQEQMQQKFLQAMEKRESDRMIREEAWRRQEMARLSKDHEIRAQERSSAAARDAALIAFLQKVTGQTVDLPTVATSTSVPIAAQPVQSAPPLLYQENVSQRYEDHDASDPSSKRWLKPEVLHLIELHSSLQSKFTEVGPKGPLWEEIANCMAKKGYPNRTAKRCKEKWENINKYFKRAKESSKKRPENAKTCPYFHELDALYRKGCGSSTNMISQLPYKPSIEHAQEENVSCQPLASNREGDLNRASSLQTQPTNTPTERAVVSDASATDASNNSSSRVGDVVRNGSTTNGNMAQSVGSMHLSMDAFRGLNASLTTSDHMPRSGFPAELGLSIQQQSSPLDQHKPVGQAEFGTLSAAGGEHMESIITQSQMQRDNMKESKPSLAALPNSSSFMANMLQKLSSSNTPTNNNGQDQ